MQSLTLHLKSPTTILSTRTRVQKSSKVTLGHLRWYHGRAQEGWGGAVSDHDEDAQGEHAARTCGDARGRDLRDSQMGPPELELPGMERTPAQHFLAIGDVWCDACNKSVNANPLTNAKQHGREGTQHDKQ